MNKDVIYIEPEDDITDIITKIEKSKEKIVALVPPKKAGVFRSVVNIKLINKSGKSAEKTVVLVTTDPSIVKLAAATKLPVTKDLQTAPIIPVVEEDDIDTSSKEDLVEDEEENEDENEDGDEDANTNKKENEKSDKVSKSKKDSNDKDVSDDDDDDEEEDEEEVDSSEKPNQKKAKKDKKKGNKIVEWIKAHKKISIFGGIGLVIIIGVLIWALVFAPAVNITVGIRTTSNNFSEAVTFVTKLEDEDASKGKFYLEEKKVETTQKVDFEATGQKNLGEKAIGEVVIYQDFPIHIPAGETVVAGDKFTVSGLSYLANDTVSLNYSGKVNDYKECDNVNSSGELENPSNKCRVSARVKVTAAEPGEKYNIARSSTGWSTTANVVPYSDKAMGGGTDKVVTVVQQIDVENAKKQLVASNEEENKSKLYDSISDDSIILESTLKQETSKAVSTPGIDEEVKEGVKPSLTTTTTTSVYIIDGSKIEEFITEKANLADDQKIYQMNDPFIEGFMETDKGYTGKIKTSYMTGPKLSSSSILDMVKGHGLGDAQHLLRDFDGVNDVKISTSVPWVTVIPDNSNKVTVILEVRDQNGNEVKPKDEDESEDKKDEEKEDSNKSSDEKEKKDEKNN